jgi:uncharacterized protein YegP (UPF0339 family)
VATGYRFFVFKGKDGQWYWRFYSLNNQILAIGGEGYVNKADCLAGLNLVASNAPGASITHAE